MSKYNTFGNRFAAGIVDGVIFWPLTLLDGYLQDSLDNQSFLFILWTIISLCAFEVYVILMHGKYGQTLGKRSMSVKVVRNSDEGKISYKQAVLRDSPYLVLLIIEIIIVVSTLLSPELAFNSTISTMTNYLASGYIIWFAVELVTMLFNSKKRALHDIIANTVVIKI
jgi:uncharacterized RDD family membrane protein YckC